MGQLESVHRLAGSPLVRKNQSRHVLRYAGRDNRGGILRGYQYGHKCLHVCLSSFDEGSARTGVPHNMFRVLCVFFFLSAILSPVNVWFAIQVAACNAILSPPVVACVSRRRLVPASDLCSSFGHLTFAVCDCASSCKL